MKLFKRILLLLVISLLTSVSAAAQADTEAQPEAAAEETASTEDLTLEQTLALPEVPQKQNSYIQKYMRREAIALHKLGYKVETMRKGEIVIVTVPTDRLFGPNETTLLASATKDLRNFLPYFRTPGKFKVVLAIHTDDTGSDTYLNDLASKRIVALYDYFDTNATDTNLLSGYPMAANDPLNEDHTRAARASNRRLEIYILPAEGLIDEARQAR